MLLNIPFTKYARLEATAKDTRYSSIKGILRLIRNNKTLNQARYD